MTQCCPHGSRLAEYLKDGKPVVGGQHDKTSKWIEPTILVDVPEDSRIMNEEVFGPILPVLNVETPEQAVDFINNR